MASERRSTSGDERLSDDDGDRRRARRRRGTRGRFKPYLRMTIEERQSLDGKEEDLAAKRRRRANSTGAPMAPYNTTQFLLEDREIRAASATTDSRVPGDPIGDHPGPSSTIGIRPQRTRSLSAGDSAAEQLVPLMVDPSNARLEFEDTSSEVGSEESDETAQRIREMDQEFRESYEQSSLEHFRQLPHEQLARQMVRMERDVDGVSDELVHSRSENERLKDLIRYFQLPVEEFVRARSGSRSSSRSSSSSSSSSSGPSPSAAAPTPRDLPKTPAASPSFEAEPSRE